MSDSPFKLKKIDCEKQSGYRWFLKDTQDRTFKNNIEKIIFLRLQNHPDKDFLDPKLKSSIKDPYILKDMEKAVKRCFKAIKLKEKIVIYGDYDVDGASSTAILYNFLAKVEANVAFYIPNRMREGYGPNTEAFLKIQKEWGAKVIMVVDSGSVAFEPIKAVSDSVDVLVFDHHDTQDIMPKAHAVVNPKRKDAFCIYYQNLAAVGVTFLFVIAMNRYLKEQDYYKKGKDQNQNSIGPDLMHYLDLVALGTVCDVVPITGVNRAFVKMGLLMLKQTKNIGMRMLISVSNIFDKPKFTTSDLGFVLGPKINAAGRIDDPNLSAQLFTTYDSKTALKIAMKLSELNTERKELEKKATQEAEAMVANGNDEKIIILYKKDWHEGVIGIIAGRIKDKLNKPVIVLCENEPGICKGSARSVHGFSIGDMLIKAKEEAICINGGGHKMAAGMTIMEDKIDDFKQFVKDYTRDLSISTTKTINIDCIIDVGGFDKNFLAGIENLAPFGEGNAPPTILIMGALITNVRMFGIKCVKLAIKSQGDFKSSIFAISFDIALNKMINDMNINEGSLYDIVLYISEENFIIKDISKCSL